MNAIANVCTLQCLIKSLAWDLIVPFLASIAVISFVESRRYRNRKYRSEKR